MLVVVAVVFFVTSTFCFFHDVYALNQHNHQSQVQRRAVISSFPPLATLLLHDQYHQSDSAANALPFIDSNNQDRRQLDLCLVNLLRLQYWAVSLSDKLQELQTNGQQDAMEKLKSAYLEARLGSKVVVAKSKKIGGGANANVFMLKGLQLKECIDDLRYYVDRSSKKQMTQYSDDLIEALASIVEFDGLETTQDPSPRSELTLKMFTVEKGVYVQRMLSERIVPLTDEMIRLFGPDTKSRTVEVVQEFYPKEVPARLQQNNDHRQDQAELRSESSRNTKI